MDEHSKESVAIVWFKRDLRIHDHEPLTLAARLTNQGIKVLPLYIIEPDYWELPDASARHWRFIKQSLIESGSFKYWTTISY